MTPSARVESTNPSMPSSAPESSPVPYTASSRSAAQPTGTGTASLENNSSSPQRSHYILWGAMGGLGLVLLCLAGTAIVWLWLKRRARAGVPSISMMRGKRLSSSLLDNPSTSGLDISRTVNNSASHLGYDIYSDTDWPTEKIPESSVG